MTRTLIRDDARGKLYEIRDDKDNVVGTDFEVALLPEQVNAQALASKAQAALAANANYLALTTPTAAQNAAQVQRLTRECNALIRLMLNLFDDTSGT